MKRFILVIITALICSLLFTGCDLQDISNEGLQDENTEGLQDGNAEETYGGNAEESDDGNVEELQGVITYPQYGKIGLNILDDGFVEAAPVGSGKPGHPVEYSLTAEVPVGAGLKIVIMTKSEEENHAWGGFYPSSLDNWLYSHYDKDTRSNTFTVYESGKRADVTVTFLEDCIIEYYENGAETPTKVKEIKVSPDVITEEKPQPDTEGLQGVITYPKYGKIGLNILADGFVEATPVGGGKPGHPIEYSMTAEIPVGAGLKIVIMTKSKDENHAWGGFYPSSIENWLYSYYDKDTRSNTFTVYESGKRADLTVTFSEDCIIEYYENGAEMPTKVKEIKVSMDVITEEKPQPDTEGLQGVITYPKYGKNGLNILTDGFVEATAVGGGKPGQPVEYSLVAEIPAGAGLKIVIMTNKEEKEDYWAWGGFYADYNENWLYSYYDKDTRSNTFTVYESGKRADLTVTFSEDCIVEYYENSDKTPTKVKEIKVKK